MVDYINYDILLVYIISFLGVTTSLLPGFDSLCGSTGLSEQYPDNYVRTDGSFLYIANVCLAISVLLAPLVASVAVLSPEKCRLVYVPAGLMWVGLQYHIDSECGSHTFGPAVYCGALQTLICAASSIRHARP